MNKFFKVTFIALVLGAGSCSIETIEDQGEGNYGDYIIFGRFNGFCQGVDCIQMFKISNGKLYEDVQDNYSQTTIEPSTFVELENEKYLAVRDLGGKIPAQLLGKESMVFGCPDCADQGGLYLEIKEGTYTKHWMIDQDKSAVPSYLHDLIDSMNEKIQLINN